jgi:carbon storage regulator
MLVLTRKTTQSIVIGENIEVVITEVKGDKVRLGIVAPQHIPVYRREVFDRIQREKEGDIPRNGKSKPVIAAMIDLTLDR